MVEKAHSRLDKLKICADCQGLGMVKLCDSGKGALHIVRDRECKRCNGEGMVYVGPPAEREAFYAARGKREQTPKPKGVEGLLAAVTLKNEGDALLASGEYDRAVEKYDEACRLDGAYLAPIANRAQCHLKRGDVDACSNDCARVVCDAPRKSALRCRALLRRAVALMTRAHAADCERAIDDCQQLLMDQPCHPRGEALLKDARLRLADHLDAERKVIHAKVDLSPDANATAVPAGATNFDNLD